MPPRSRIRQEAISDIARQLGVSEEALADAVGAAGGDIAAAAEALGADLLDLFGPSRKPSRRVRRAFSGSYRRSFLRRTAGARSRGESIRESAGHRVYDGPVDRSASLFVESDEGPRFAQLHGISASELRRAGIYMGAVGQLAQDRYVTPGGVRLHGAAAQRNFRRRFSRWQPIGGYRVVSDPAAVLALAADTAGSGQRIDFVSPKRRRSRRGRS
jgi:hypothetical protein